MDVNIWETLPDEICVLIIFFVGSKNLYHIHLTSRYFLSVCQSEGLWEKFCVADKSINWKPPEMQWKSLWRMEIQHCPHLGLMPHTEVQGAAERIQTMYDQRDSISCSSQGCPYHFSYLWACLSCDHAGCARRFNKHAFLHHQSSEHALCVKLQTLELFCLKCEVWLGVPSRCEVERLRVLNIKASLQRCAPPALKTWFEQETIERRQLEREVRWYDQKDRSWSIVPSVWHKKWVEYVAGDTNPPPEGFDTGIFINPDGTLKDLEHWSYISISNEQFAFLAKQYSAKGPHIIYDRKVHSWVINPSPERLIGTL